MKDELRYVCYTSTLVCYLDFQILPRSRSIHAISSIRVLERLSPSLKSMEEENVIHSEPCRLSSFISLLDVACLLKIESFHPTLMCRSYLKDTREKINKLKHKKTRFLIRNWYFFIDFTENTERVSRALEIYTRHKIFGINFWKNEQRKWCFLRTTNKFNRLIICLVSTYT